MADANLPMEREVTITRVFDAPRELVFKAWTDPAHLIQWFGPKVFTNSVCEVDLRVGGALYIVMRAPDGSEYPMRGVFQEIESPSRLVFINNAVDANDNVIIAGLTTVIFADEAGKTRLTMVTRGKAMVDYAAQYLEGMEMGWIMSLDKLEEHLAKS